MIGRKITFHFLLLFLVRKFDFKNMFHASLLVVKYLT